MWSHCQWEHQPPCKNASRLCLQKLNDSWAKEPICTHAKSATWMLSTKSSFQSIVKHNCKHLNANRQKCYCSCFILYESPFDGILDGWKNSWSLFNERFQWRPMAKLSQCNKNTQDFITYKVEKLCILGVLKQQQASTWALPSSIVPNKQIKLCNFLAIFWM